MVRLTFLKSIFFIIFIYLFFLSDGIAQYNKESLFEALSKKYQGINTISLKFKSGEVLLNRGNLRAKKGNKYLIRTADRYLICNGSTIWNHSFADNKVVISNFQSSKSLSIDNFFFSFLDNFQPISLVRQVSSRGSVNMVLELESNNESYKTSGLKKIKISVESGTLNITLLQFGEGVSMQTWYISNIKLNEKINDKTFEYQVPKDAEIIDLR